MKKRNLICAAVLVAGVMLCGGCSSELTKYIDEEKASDIATFGKSFIEDKGDDIATLGKSFLDEKGDDIAALGKSYVSDKSDELISDAIQSSSELISQLVESVKAGKSEDGDSSFSGSDDEKQSDNASEGTGKSSSKGLLSSTVDLNFRDVDGKDKNYAFDYNGEEYSVEYCEDHWKIMDSYKINDSNDMVIICQALIDVHPVHGADMQSFRTADDMAYEWVQHNLAYEFLPEDNEWRIKSKDVDLNPEDQGKSFVEIYEERTGKEFKLSDFFH